MQRIRLNLIEGNPPFKPDMLIVVREGENEQRNHNNTI